LDPYDSKHNRGSEQDGLANSSENDHCKNQVPTCSEEQVIAFLLYFTRTYIVAFAWFFYSSTSRF
jgi:hypothetical protein